MTRFGRGSLSRTHVLEAGKNSSWMGAAQGSMLSETVCTWSRRRTVFVHNGLLLAYEGNEPSEEGGWAMRCTPQSCCSRLYCLTCRHLRGCRSRSDCCLRHYCWGRHAIEHQGFLHSKHSAIRSNAALFDPLISSSTLVI